jgi:hypothetical protein
MRTSLATDGGETNTDWAFPARLEDVYNAKVVKRRGRVVDTVSS